MYALGFRKSRKQVYERWVNILNPELNSHNFTIGDVEKLFKLQEIHQNKWRLIASSFPGKTDNFIKNKFFSLTRKALRLASKLAERPTSTRWVNSLKPKSILRAFDRQLKIESPGHLAHFNQQIITFREIFLILIKINPKDESVVFEEPEVEILNRFLTELEQVNNDVFAETGLPPTSPPKSNRKARRSKIVVPQVSRPSAGLLTIKLKNVESPPICKVKSQNSLKVKEAGPLFDSESKDRFHLVDKPNLNSQGMNFNQEEIGLSPTSLRAYPDKLPAVFIPKSHPHQYANMFSSIEPLNELQSPTHPNKMNRSTDCNLNNDFFNEGYDNDSLLIQSENEIVEQNRNKRVFRG